MNVDDLNEERALFGNMDSDSDASTIQNPNIIESHNTRVGVNGAATQKSRTPILGTALPFSIGDAFSAQDKIVLIEPTLIILDNQPHDLTFSFYNRISGSPVGSTQSGTFTGNTTALFKTFMDGLVTAAGFTYSSAATLNAVQYTFTTEDCIISTTASTASIIITVTQEYITAQEGGGNLIPIAIENVGDYVYIWSCNKDTYPTSGYAIGEVGRATYDENYDTWTYTRLIQSKDFRFLTIYQPDNPKIEKNDYRTSMYWVTVNQPPKALYADTINTKFLLDGSLTVFVASTSDVDLSKIYYQDGNCKINVCGEQRTILTIDNTNKTITVTSPFSRQYQNVYVDIEDISLEYRYNSGYGLSYDNIKSQTDQFPVIENIGIDFLSVQSGGSITSGNKRYIARGVSADLVEYGWSRASGYIAVCGATPNALSVGDLDNINSGKSVTLRLSNIDTTFFKYVDLAVINYSNSFPSAEFVRRIVVSSSEMDVTHVGSENGGAVDLNTITDSSLYFEYAKSNEIISNRNLLGNVKIVQPSDFTEFCLSATHEIARDILPSTPSTIKAGSLSYGEYMNPANTFQTGSLVVNETYRVGFRIEEYSGAISDTWVDDIRIDIATNNISYGTVYNGQTIGQRRVANLTDLDLTDDKFNPYYYYLKLTPNWLITIDGKTPQEVIKSIEVVFAPMDGKREVLASGLAVVSTGYYTDGVALTANYYRPWNMYANKVDIWLNKNTVSCYFPDVLFGQADLQFTAGDQLAVYGRQNPISDITTATYRYQLYKGDMSFNNINQINQTLDIEDISYVNKYGQTTLGAAGVQYFQNVSGTSGATPSVWVHENAVAIKFTAGSNISNWGTVADTTPLYYVKYMRPRAYVSPDECKFGSVFTTSYYPVGSPITKIDYGTSFIEGIGNDSFIQSFHFKEMYPMKNTGLTTTTYGFGATFYCQNICNTQMRAWTPEDVNLRLFPNSFARLDAVSALNSWLSYWWVDGTTVIQDEFSYDGSYNYSRGIQPEIGSNPDLISNPVASTAIYWTDKKPQNSTSDSYRRAFAGNVHYLDAVDGDITDLFEFGTELYANQEFNTRRLYYNETGQLQTAPNLSVIIGGGSVMGRDGYSITKFGSRHQQSNIYGISENGNDIRYWFDTVNSKIVRFGGNGVEPISDTKLLNFDTKTRTKWASLFNYPAYSYGIHGTFDMGNREMLMTFRGQKICDDFNVGSYTVGDVVADATPYDLNFYSLPKTLYKAKRTGVLSAPTGADDDPNWLFVPLTNTDYYSWTTFVYSELTKGFSTYYDFCPRIFGKYQKTILSSRPVVGEEDSIFPHNGTAICRWWDLGGDYYEADPTITIPFNIKPDATKKWVYVNIDSDASPYRMDFEAVDDGKVSFLIESEFTQRRDKWVSPIKNDSTVTIDNPSGLNSAFTGPLRSKALKMIYNIGTSQTMSVLRRIFVKSRELDKKTSA